MAPIIWENVLNFTKLFSKPFLQNTSGRASGDYAYLRKSAAKPFS